MEEPQSPIQPNPSMATGPEGDPPPANHPLEVAARRGIGPLSPLGQSAWHGHAKPCVTCGQLVEREATECGECGQDLSSEMIEKMCAHAGPWYVLEHVRPFPGVSLERIIRQVRRGLITETSIVRGPATEYQWRYAVETPGLCRYFGRCWNCHEAVSPSETHCKYCLSNLSFEQRHPAPAVPPSPQSVVSAMGPGSDMSVEPGAQLTDAATDPRHDEAFQALAAVGPDDSSAGSANQPGASSHAVNPTSSEDLKHLSAVVSRNDLPAHDALWDEPPRIAGIRATWVATALIIIVIIALLWFTQSRGGSNPTPPAAAGIVLPQ